MNSSVNAVSLKDLKDVQVFSIGAGIPQRKEPLVIVPHKKNTSLKFDTYAYFAGYEMPKYDLYEITAALDSDTYFKRSVKKKRALGNKEGWTLTGKNNITREYIQFRFKQLSIAQGRSMNLLIKDLFGDLVAYNNAFWLKERDKNVPGASIREIKAGTGRIKEVDPVAAYFHIPVETIRIKKDTFGNPKKYMQLMPDGRKKEFNPEDIIHWKFMPKPGMSIAPPSNLAVIDDIKALRRIEESVELIIDKHLFPLLVLSIGNDEYPMIENPDGTSEVETWAEKISIDGIPSSGAMVVSHRFKFEPIGYEQTIPIQEYLDYFKRRVFAGLGVSNLDMGEGDGMNRSTADNASKILIDDVKDYQDEIKWQIESDIISELLLERFNSNALLDQNFVSFTWTEIDLEHKIKKENHNGLMYSMHIKTENEVRTANGDPILDNESEREGLYIYKVIEEELMLQKKHAIPTATSSSTTTSKSSKSKKTAQNKNKPTNQHGSKSGPTQRTSSAEIDPVKLSMFMGDFSDYDNDLMKLRLINYVFTIDLSKYQSDFSNVILNIIESSVDDAYNSLQDNTLDKQTAKDILIENIVSAFQQ